MFITPTEMPGSSSSRGTDLSFGQTRRGSSSSQETGPSQLQTKAVLDKLTKPQLQKLAKSFDVPAPTTLTKAELVDTLLAHPTQKQIGGSSDRRLIHNDPAAKTLALLKLQDLAKQYHLLKPGKKLPGRSQKAIKECCGAAEISLNSYLSTPTGQKLLNQKGGYIGGLSQTAFWGLTIGGAFLLGSVIALIIYLKRRGSPQSPESSAQIPQSFPAQIPQSFPVGVQKRLTYGVRPMPQTQAEFKGAYERGKAFGVGMIPGEHLPEVRAQIISGQYAPAPHRARPTGRPGKITIKQPLTYHQLPPETESIYQPELPLGRTYQQRPMIPTSAGVYESLPIYPAENV